MTLTLRKEWCWCFQITKDRTKCKKEADITLSDMEEMNMYAIKAAHI